MLAEVISIGDELTSGQRLDTNSQWLSQRLGELGLKVGFHTTVGDDLAANIAVFRAAVERADVVVATGGLGPTADDLTREALAAVAGVELELHEPSLEKIRGMFAHFGREMPERNRVQALFPRGSRILANDHGTAPGIDLDMPRAGGGRSRVFALPGVPAEMFHMWAGGVAPALAALATGRVLRHRVIKCFGVGESHLESMLPDLIRRGRQPTVGITASQATLSLRITASGADEAECLEAMRPTVETIYQSLGDLIFGEGEIELEHAVLQLLAQRRRTLALAEWGTAGTVEALLGALPSSSAHVVAGFAARSVAQWSRILDIAPESLEIDGGAGGASAAALAVAARHRAGADLALATAALPTDAAAGARQAPKVYLAVAGDEGIVVRSAPCFGEPSLRFARTAKQALNLVRLALLRGLKEARE